VETQTHKLMEVCRMRNTPVIIFINKMDREGRDPFDLLDELEEELSIKVRPLSWPINIGAKFKGVYNIYENKLDLFKPDKQRVTEKVEVDINSDELSQHIGEQDAQQLRDDIELIDGVYPEFDVETYRNAEVAPVFFGSALNNFGVQELLNCFVKIAPSPRPTQAEERLVDPEEPKFTGFIFKITANIDPNHRSCIAFCKVCSGKFERNKPYLHVRHGKTYYAIPAKESSNYGYLSTFNVEGTVDELKIKSSYDDSFAFETLDDGFSIKDCYGRYLYMDTQHNSFQFDKEKSEAWTVEADENGTFSITNNDKFIQFGSGTFTSFGAYDKLQDNAVLPMLFVLNDNESGINGVTNDNTVKNGARYNLAGQRVNNSYKGIVIDVLEHLRRERRQSAEMELLAVCQRIANLEDAVIGQSDDIARPCLLNGALALRHKLRR
jgi:hypothetical protein